MYKNTTEEQTSYVGKCGAREAYDPFNRKCKIVCITGDSNCTRSLIKARNDIPEYDSYDYNIDEKYNLNYWNDWIEEYYLTRDQPVFDYKDFDGDCLELWTCNGIVPANESSTFCFCDQLCGVYGDCCPDVDVSSEDDVVKTSFGCSYIPRIYDNWFVFVVNSCPEGTRYELDRLCSEPDEQNVYHFYASQWSKHGVYLPKHVLCSV